MNEPRKDVAVGMPMDEGRDNEADDQAMSPEIRRLILSYTEVDSERTWNADSLTGRRANAA
jgi:hypothetical protein